MQPQDSIHHIPTATIPALRAPLTTTTTIILIMPRHHLPLRTSIEEQQGMVYMSTDLTILEQH